MTSRPSISETLKQRIDELDLDRRLDEVVEQAQSALTVARERAAELAVDHGDELRTWIDRAATTVDSRTEGRWSEQVDRVRDGLSGSIERLAEDAGRQSDDPDPSAGPVGGDHPTDQDPDDPDDPDDPTEHPTGG